MRPTVPVFATSVILLTTILSAAQPAMADLKIVSEVRSSGNFGMGGPGAAPSGRTMIQTSYFKGDKFRQESETHVTIFDCATSTIYLINPKDKTYSTMDLQKIMDMAGSNPMMAGMKFETTAEVMPTTHTEIIAGRKAQEYLYTVSMKITREGMDSSMMPAMKMSGEEWVTSSLAFPAKCKRMQQFARQMPGMMGNSMKALADKMSVIKGYPLRNTISMSMGGGPSQMPRKPITTVTEVKSIVEVPLPNSLFVVPADYKKTESPMMGPGMGGPGMGRPGRPGMPMPR